jgi:hypothetical protein
MEDMEQKQRVDKSDGKMCVLSRILINIKGIEVEVSLWNWQLQRPSEVSETEEICVSKSLVPKAGPVVQVKEVIRSGNQGHSKGYLRKSVFRMEPLW